LQFVVIRLGKDSVLEIKQLDGTDTNTFVPFNFSFVCTQVEEGIGPDDYVILWLGSDNNKGQPTAWKQGVRAIGRITGLQRSGGFNDPCDIQIEVISVLPESVDQFDFLERSASHYKYFSKYPVVGVRSSRNNAIQKVNEDDRQKTSALLTAISILFPDIEDHFETHAPELISMLNFIPVGEAQTASPSKSIVSDTDPVWAWVSAEIFKKNERNFLFLGAPGTGKTWYAHEIAKKLTNSESGRSAFVQFHPSFSYDDFVEGYTPRLRDGGTAVEYRIQAKHFLKLADKAKGDGSNLYVLVIDELTRGDPSRVFGELLTYLEVDHRNREFSLAYSGETTFVPKNLIVLATANPFDRSVGELDDALVRRFAMRDFPPDPKLLAERLHKIGVSQALAPRLLHIFDLINQRLDNGFGHSHFWNVRTEADFRDLWSSRILFLLKRALQFDDGALQSLTDEIAAVFPDPVVEEPEAQEVQDGQGLNDPITAGVEPDSNTP
jgi:hypothetical protein